MLSIAIIIGSTQPRRKSEVVEKWAYDISRHRSDAEFELLDLVGISDAEQQAVEAREHHKDGQAFQ